MKFKSEAEIARIGEGLIACALPGAEWTHAAHWAAAFWLIARRPELHPPRDMPGLIRAFNASLGNQNTETSGYHETITQASLRAARDWLVNAAPEEMLHETLNRLLASPLGGSNWLLAYWSKEKLMSPAVRRAWAEPDLAPFPFPAFPFPAQPNPAEPPAAEPSPAKA